MGWQHPDLAKDIDTPLTRGERAIVLAVIVIAVALATGLWLGVQQAPQWF